MNQTKSFSHPTLRLYGVKSLDRIAPLRDQHPGLIRGIQTAAAVFPFRVNNYVIDELIDWEAVPDDPIFRLTFPQPEMLDSIDRRKLETLLAQNAPAAAIGQAAQCIQMRLNPHPAGQMALNVPVENGRVFAGMQHKYPETLLFFPSQGQTCHAFCTYCFRWAQFAGIDRLRFANRDPRQLVTYLERHPEVTDVLFTGGDPLTMSAKLLKTYIEPLLRHRPGGLSTIRIGTKVLAYWPHRFLTDRDADDLLSLFSKVTAGGLHLGIMAHFSHPRELEPPAVQAAVQRLLETGATLRCQAPLIRHINDDADTWARMWRAQVRLGAIPYYMFVERDTGPKEYFKVPLARAYRIFSDAYRQVSGLCRTVRGPSMSATPGKVLLDGVTMVGRQKVFVLKFIQGRNPEWVNRVFFAAYDPQAAWLDDLKPAFNADRFFYEPELKRLKALQAEEMAGLASEATTTSDLEWA
jgi:L-lysine 2,3-aminomutase